MEKTKQNLKTESLRLTEELLYLIGVEAEVDLEITTDPDEEFVVNIKIQNSDESGLLIGSRGSTLNAIQSFIALALRQRFEDWIRVNLDIDEWKQKHEDYLEDIAAQTAMRAQETGEPQAVYNLNPAQRRIIHMHLSKNKSVITESTGEGRDRYLVVKPK